MEIEEDISEATDEEAVSMDWNAYRDVENLKNSFLDDGAIFVAKRGMREGRVDGFGVDGVFFLCKCEKCVGMQLSLEIKKQTL